MEVAMVRPLVFIAKVFAFSCIFAASVSGCATNSQFQNYQLEMNQKYKSLEDKITKLEDRIVENSIIIRRINKDRHEPSN
jgi:uncharacterized lipoprotein YmbA